jgi:hypothetical protein
VRRGGKAEGGGNFKKKGKKEINRESGKKEVREQVARGKDEKKI